jgi:biopolymer transport protein ExbD/biopolymer transport protein TolR
MVGKEDAILIAITRDGKVFLSPGNSLIQIDQLPAKVKDLQQNRSDKTVYIRADARARFSSVTDVIDALRTDGVDTIGLITEAIQDKNRKSLGL